MKVVVDRSKCLALGMCESLAPDLFQVNEDSELALMADEIPPEMLGEVEAAVSACPTEALRIVDL